MLTEKAGQKEGTEALIRLGSTRLCKDAPDTIQDIITGCKVQAGKEYMECNN